MPKVTNPSIPSLQWNRKAVATAQVIATLAIIVALTATLLLAKTPLSLSDKVWKALEGLTFGIPLILGNGIALYFQHGWYKQIAQHKEKSTDDDGEHGENLQG